MLANTKRVYQLATFTVELRPKGWFYWPSYGDKSDVKGPYKNPTSVSLMIARRLRKEIERRDAVHALPE